MSSEPQPHFTLTDWDRRLVETGVHDGSGHAAPPLEELGNWIRVRCNVTGKEWRATESQGGVAGKYLRLAHGVQLRCRFCAGYEDALVLGYVAT